MFASAHRVTGPWDHEEFDVNDEDNLPGVVKVITEDYDNKSDPTKIAEVKQLVRCLYEENDYFQGDWRWREDVAFISFFFFFSLLSHRTTVLLRGV